MNDTPVDSPNTTKPPQVVVLDIPVDTTAEGMARLIEQHSGDFYLLAVLPWPGVGARAVFRKHAALARKEKKADGSLPEYRHADGKDEAAFALLKTHRGTSTRQMSTILKENGISRGKDWVMLQRNALATKESRA